MSVLQEVQAFQVDVVITPECFLDGYVVTEGQVTRENLVDYAVDPAKSPYIDAVSKWAAENGTWFVMGCTRFDAKGACNTALILNREGRLAGVYDKVHLW